LKRQKGFGKMGDASPLLTRSLLGSKDMSLDIFLETPKKQSEEEEKYWIYIPTHVSCDPPYLFHGRWIPTDYETWQRNRYNCLFHCKEPLRAMHMWNNMWK
jgi:hypothetical protein